MRTASSTTIIAAATLLAGCASSASEVRPTYVSSLQYEHLTCKQIAAEASNISRRASELSGVQNANSSRDAWTTAGAIILFWPAAFFVKGDGQTTAELARLKGEFEALEKVSIQKNCGLQFRPNQVAQAR